MALVKLRGEICAHRRVGVAVHIDDQAFPPYGRGTRSAFGTSRAGANEVIPQSLIPAGGKRVAAEAETHHGHVSGVIAEDQRPAEDGGGAVVTADDASDIARHFASAAWKVARWSRS